MTKGRECSVCNTEKPLNKKYYHIKSSSRFGYDTACKECRKIELKQRAKRNKKGFDKKAIQEAKDQKAYERLLNTPPDLGVGDKLETLDFIISKKYELERKTQISQCDDNYETVFRGKLIGETNNLIILKHNKGYNTAFSKYDILIGEYNIKEV